MNKSSIRRFIFEHFLRLAQDMVSNLLVSIAPCWLVDWLLGYNVMIDARVIHIRNSGHKQCNPRK